MPMTPTLRNYILRNLGPSELRLELVNRFDNLCTLSGTPMSPELHQWMERTFGLEMVRVIQDYSSLTPPVFSPDMLNTINRIIPSNYQGDDINMMFKQQFDTNCGYFWVAQFTSDGMGASSVIVNNDISVSMDGSSPYDFGLQFQNTATYPCGGYINQFGDGQLWAYSPIEPPGNWYSLDLGSFNTYPFTWTKSAIFDNISRSCHTLSYSASFAQCNSITSSWAGIFVGIADGFAADMEFDFTQIQSLLIGIFGSQVVVDIYPIDPTTNGIDLLNCNAAIVPIDMNIIPDGTIPFTIIPCK